MIMPDKLKKLLFTVGVKLFDAFLLFRSFY